MKSDIAKVKIKSIYKKLIKEYPDVRCELDFSTPLELAVATILSAQCTDKMVNKVTPGLFKKFKKPKDYIQADILEIEEAIKSIGLYRSKAKNLKKMMEILHEEYGDVLPSSLEELVQLPGIGRKTANVVLGNGFDIPGFPVDTHVIRLTNLLGFVKTKDAVRIEKEITDLVPAKDWTKLSLLLIFHGRRVCKARTPLCEECVISKDCNFYLRSK